MYQIVHLTVTGRLSDNLIIGNYNLIKDVVINTLKYKFEYLSESENDEDLYERVNDLSHNLIILKDGLPFLLNI